MYDFTAVLNLHREGREFIPSYRSIINNIDACAKESLSCAVILYLDRPDELTLNLANKIYETDKDHYNLSILIGRNGDLGESRNQAVNSAKSKWLAFLDGDDLWGTNWVLNAIEYAKKLEDNGLARYVLHPESNFYFGMSEHIFIHKDMDDPDFDIYEILETNLWTALSFSLVDLYKEMPYPVTDIANKIGYEDWGWNMATIGEGIVHKIVPSTAHYIKSSQDSLLKNTNSNKCLPNISHKFVNYMRHIRQSNL